VTELPYLALEGEMKIKRSIKKKKKKRKLNQNHKS
jgi:hypothetical protein